MSINQIWSVLICSLSVAGCGVGTMSDYLTAENSDDRNKNESGVKITNGTYSFVFTDFNYTCSDGTTGTSLGGAMQMIVEVSGGYLSFQQSAVSSRSSVERAATIGPRVVSSTSPSGPIDRAGAFTTTSVSVFDDPKYGILNVTYKVSGQFKGTQWSGKYETLMNAPDMGLICNYKSYFSGSLQP
ncbi:MAG: hypothetical protein EBR09_15890 [Proteobacteria bacterium]|nr:hypothetical protein [Pseudomonadota bacterium]